MKKKKVLAILVVLLILIGTGVYSYARYVYTKSGSGSKNVATWAVTLKQGGNPVTDDFNLALSLSANDNVVNGKIAPSRSATATLVLDLTGTEVATDVEVDLSSVTGLPNGMSITGVTANGNAMTEDSGVYTTMIALNAGKTAISTNTVTLVITAEWANNESNNANDTTYGSTHGTLTIPVTVTAKQHIGVALVPASEACFDYTTTNNEVTITDYYDYEDANNSNPECPRDVVIPSTLGGNPVKVLDEWSFWDRMITSAVIPSGITTIGDHAFAENQLTSIEIPDSVTSIGDAAFGINLLTDVTISQNITRIGKSTFSANLLTSVEIPSGVTSIDMYAFQDNRLTSITIPSSVTSIGNYAFTDNLLTSVCIKGKSSSSDFTSYGTPLFGWAAGYSDANITWNCI